MMADAGGYESYMLTYRWSQCARDQRISTTGSPSLDWSPTDTFMLTLLLGTTKPRTGAKRARVAHCFIRVGGPTVDSDCRWMGILMDETTMECTAELWLEAMW